MSKKTLWTETATQHAINEAKRWLGTPHRNRMAKVGVGIDCLQLLRQIACASGILPPFQYPFYNPLWGIGRQNNVLERVFTLCSFCDVHSPNDRLLETGDVLIFTVGRQSNHCAIYLEGLVWHSQAQRGVLAEKPEELELTIQSVISLTAPGLKRRPETLEQSDFTA